MQEVTTKTKGNSGKKPKETKALLGESQVVTIPAPNMRVANITIIGESPLVINAFSKKAKDQMKEKQLAGSTALKGKKREPKDFQAMYQESLHVSDEGWYGIPATAFRNAMISACRTVGFMMTRAKLSVFCLADGFDKVDHVPLVRITKGEPEYFESAVRLADGSPDIHARGLWKPGWEALVRIRYDADIMTAGDIANLLTRVGLQVGIMEGRYDSKKSPGQGWGCFRLQTEEESKKVGK